MRKTSWAWAVVAILVAGPMQASASMPYPAGTEDDLALVKRAVAASAQATEPPARPPRTAEVAPAAEARKKSDKPQWLRVRVVEKGSKKGKVSINVPLNLVRALGDDLPLDFDCDYRAGKEDRRKACTIKIGDILQALDAGQDLVEVDDDEATVRIWVE